MRYILSRHANDTTMIEATYNYTSGITKNVITILAFVIHEDCLEDDEIKDLMDKEGTAQIEIKLIV